MTTDNGSNIKKALQDLSWTNLSCFGHNLHLAVNKALDDKCVTRVLGKCRSIVSLFTSSWKMRRGLKEAQSDLGLPEHQLVTDCPTRWGAKFDMMKRLIEQEPALRRVLSANRKTAHLALAWQDTQLLESVCAALDKVGEFTDILSHENYVSVSSLKPLLSILDSQILDTTNDARALTSEMKNVIKNNIKGRYRNIDINDLLVRSTFLDPKFKTSYLSDNELELVKTHILEDTSLHNVYNTACNVTCDSPVTKKKTLGSLFARSVQPIDFEDPGDSSHVEIELNAYIACVTPDEESNPLDWWKLHDKTFPTIANFAKKYLCVTATSCPSERLFSKSGQIVSSKRACLKPEKVNMLSFLAANMPKFNAK